MKKFILSILIIGNFSFAINTSTLNEAIKDLSKIASKLHLHNNPSREENKNNFQNAETYYKEGLNYLKKNEFKLALNFFQKACDLNYAIACGYVGYVYEKVNPTNYQIILNNYKKACELGNGWACDKVGYFYKKGIGVDIDYFIAMDYYKRACKLNYGPGCWNLGSIYEKTFKYYKAISYYVKGCQLNDAASCSSLAFCFIKGKGVDKNISKAIKYYDKACNLNDGIISGMNCYTEAYFYEKGKGINLNYKKALELYLKGCQLGYRKSCEKTLKLQDKIYTNLFTPEVMEEIEKNPDKSFKELFWILFKRDEGKNLPFGKIGKVQFLSKKKRVSVGIIFSSNFVKSNNENAYSLNKFFIADYAYKICRPDLKIFQIVSYFIKNHGYSIEISGYLDDYSHFLGGYIINVDTCREVDKFIDKNSYLRFFLKNY